MKWIESRLKREVAVIGDWKFSKKIAFVFDGEIEEKYFLGMDEPEIDREIKAFIEGIEVEEQDAAETRRSEPSDPKIDTGVTA